jgi:hypothetical protein
MSANIKASVDGTQAIIGVGGVDQMTVSNAGVVTANSFVGAISNTNVTATGSTTARTLANRFADVVNVKDFGAVGDGVADDTAAFVAAQNAGRNIFIPSGEYLIDTFVFPDFNQTNGWMICGENMGDTILTAKYANKPIFSANATYSDCNNVSNLSLKCNVLGSTGPAVDMKGISFSTFQNISILSNGSSKWGQAFSFYAKDLPPSGHCYVNNLDGISVRENSISDSVFLFTNNPNANRINRVTVSPKQGGPILSVPYVVKLLNPDTNVANLIFSEFHVECQVTQRCFEFGNINKNIIVKDSWIEIDGLAMNPANSSDIQFENCTFNGVSIPTPYPDNFGFLNCQPGHQISDRIKNTQQIIFNSSVTVPSTNPKALDEYFESTWTPILRGSTTVGTTSGSVRGHYIKIGKRVFAEFAFIDVTLTGASGNLIISGLPYIADNGTPFYSVPIVNFGVANILSTSSGDTLFAYGNPGTTQIQIELSNNSTSAPVNISQIKANLYLYGCIEYTSNN